MGVRSRLAMLAGLTCAAALSEQPKRILLVTHSAGFRHDSIAAARETLESLAPSRFAVTSTEDLAYIRAGRLDEFQAVFFFTSGELPLDPQQKADLLAFIRNGGGFAGAHSATDTLYTWPEYGDLIGGYFDGHPWVGQTDIEIEDPDHPASRAFAGTSFRILDEIYKFRDFSRDRSRVLMTLRSSLDGGVNKPEYPVDSPLAWCREYGRGRVFYTALGHFDETWRDERIRRMLLQVLGWLTGEEPGDASVRPANAATPRIARVAEPAQQGFEGTVAAGAKVSVLGENLTSGSTMAASPGEPAIRLAGSWVTLEGHPVRILFASPARIDILLPAGLPPSGDTTLTVASGTDTNRASFPLRLAPAVPGIYSVEWHTAQILVHAGGIANGRTARVLLDGEELEKAAVFATEPGSWQVLVRRPAAALAPGAHTLTLESEGLSTELTVFVEPL